ncbi:hypothetical protein M8J76_012890 [Diaphorina citri]|nr:hypothetical protein M8J76_012890 [Diaphorina citri]
MTCITRVFALIFCFSFSFFPLLHYSNARDAEILAAVILPANNRNHISLSRVLPLLLMAEKEVKARHILNGLRFKFMPRDGSCNDQLAQINAVEAYYKEHVNVFFGPTCEYCVAPIARMLQFWDTPLLTTGAFTFDFTKNKTDTTIENSGEYKLLTRVSPMAFEGLTSVVIQILRRNGWRRVMLFYEKNGYDLLSGLHTCQLMMETLVNGLKKEKVHYAAFDTEKNKGHTLTHNLKVEIGGAFGGK